MKAITRLEYGAPNLIDIDEIPLPVLKKDEVLVKVYATTVNRTDCAILSGKPLAMRLLLGLTRPNRVVLGTDFAGEVVKMGQEVSNFIKGDRVWGFNDMGLSSQAAFMKISAYGTIVPIPKRYTYQEVVVCAEGAHYAYNFINKVDVQKGTRVLVNGATGAIGLAALQQLKYMQAFVTAIGNGKNMKLLKKLGADKIYDYEQEDFTQVENELYDYIFDTVGKSRFEWCKHLLRPGGAYLSSELGPNAENLYLPFVTRFSGTKKVIFPIPQDCRRTLLYMNGLLEKGVFKPVIDKVYKPELVREAYQYANSGQKTGNIVLDTTGLH